MDYTTGVQDVTVNGARFWRVTVEDEFGTVYERDYSQDAMTSEDALDDLVQLVTGEWR